MLNCRRQMLFLQSLWIVFSALLFGVMGICVKSAAAYFSVLELVLYRSLIICILVFAFARFRRKTLRTGNFRVHLWRGATGFVALYLFFYALPQLHLSTVTALRQTSPLFFLLLTAVFLRERMPPTLLIALATSFVGMLFVLRPGAGEEDLLAGVAALGAGAMAGAAYFNIRRLGILNEGGIRTVFYFSAISTVLASLLMAGYGNFSPITGKGALWLITIGVLAGGGQLALTRGLHYGAPLVASTLMYSGIIFGGLFDYLLWGDVPDAPAWLGIALISGGGIGAACLTRRRQTS